jgi:hypothetical protein
MNGLSSKLDLPDREGIERRIRSAAERLSPELLIDRLEVAHLADVVTNHSLLLNDHYATHRLDRIMGQDPSAIAHGLADLAGSDTSAGSRTMSGSSATSASTTSVCSAWSATGASTCDTWESGATASLPRSWNASPRTGA